MKYIKVLILMFIVFIMVIPSNVFAAEPTGFQTSKISEDKLDSYLNSFSVSLLTEAPENLGIKSFDVNESGQIAIGSQIGQECCLHVYDSNFDFLYGFYFYCSGTYQIEWNNDYINIYYVRSDIAVTYGCNGEIISIAEIDNTTNNNSYWNILRSNERRVNNTIFKAKNDKGILNVLKASYSQLVKIDDLGNEIVLYNVSSFQSAKTIMIFIVASLLVAIVILIIKKGDKQSK